MRLRHQQYGSKGIRRTLAISCPTQVSVNVEKASVPVQYMTEFMGEREQGLWCRLICVDQNKREFCVSD